MDKVKNKANVNHGISMGSYLSRKICTKFRPLFCIGGHMHEYYGKKKLSKTTVINAGYGRDAQVLLDLNEKKKKIRKVEFWDSKNKKN